MSSGQIANQVFIYMTAAILFGMVLIYGTSAVESFIDKSKVIDMIELKNKLESKVEQIAPTQDRMVFDFKIPSGHDTICFIDRRQGGTNCNSPVEGPNCFEACRQPPHELNPIVCDAWIDNVTQNVFLLDPMASTPIRTGPIELVDENGDDQGFMCIDVRKGSMKLAFQGKGDRVQIQTR